MAEDPKPFRCGVAPCDQLRDKDSNHWWIVVVRHAFEANEFVEVRKWNSILARRAMNPQTPGNAFIYLACGQSCLQTLVGRISSEMIQHAQPPKEETPDAA